MYYTVHGQNTDNFPPTRDGYLTRSNQTTASNMTVAKRMTARTTFSRSGVICNMPRVRIRVLHKKDGGERGIVSGQSSPSLPINRLLIWGVAPQPVIHSANNRSGHNDDYGTGANFSAVMSLSRARTFGRLPNVPLQSTHSALVARTVRDCVRVSEGGRHAN